MEKDVLKKFTPFDGLQDEYLDEALEKIVEENAPKGQMLFKRGRPVASRFFLVEGQVDLIDSQFNAKTLKGGTVMASTTLNPESPTRCSGVVKSDSAIVFSIETETLDRITAWSESAEAAFEAQMSDKQIFDPSATGQFDVLDVEEELSNDWMSSLLKSPLFSRVPLTHVQDLFSRFEDVSVNKDDIIIKEGQKGDFFYVLARGSARISNRSGSVDVTVGPGQLFGEEALLGSTLRNATIKMLEDGELKRLGAEDFQALLSEPVLQFLSSNQLDSLDRPHKLIDVKMPLEYRAFHEQGSINLPLARLRVSMPELAKTNAYIVTGDSGSRAKIAAHLLCQSGFEAYILNYEEQKAGQEPEQEDAREAS